MCAGDPVLPRAGALAGGHLGGGAGQGPRHPLRPAAGDGQDLRGGGADEVRSSWLLLIGLTDTS